MRSTINKSELLKKHTIIIEPKKSHDFVAKIMGASDFLIIPSLTEGFGFVAAEALSIGVPVIATLGTALVEVVPRDRGIFVRPRDSEGLSKAIIKLIENKKLLKSLSKPVSFFDWNHIGKEYEKIYNGLV
jgi:glycosyltransferase involved in cell wall biosynthesis